MNFTQMQEQLRVELLRRIQRGSLSISLLSRQTGFGPSHLSNFLHKRRQLSLAAMDRMLAAQHLVAADLVPARQRFREGSEDESSSAVPLISNSTALFEPYVRPSAVQSMVNLPRGALASIRSRAPANRRAWERFVAVRIPSADALPMEPLVLPEALVVIDRHYNSLVPFRPNRPNLYAIRHGAHLVLRYAELLSSRLVLRPLNISFPVELIDVGPDGSPGDLITGRVALLIHEP